MNKLLLLVVVCVLSVSTVGATATVSATQLGHSPFYYFDVTYNGKTVGQVVVDTAKTPIYTLVANGLTPNTNYTFGYNASGVVNPLGSTSTTAAGVLSVHWTFPAADVKDLQSAQFWVTETPPASAGYTQISGLMLYNDGWFVAKLACEYSIDGGPWTESSSVNCQGLGGSAFIYLGKYGLGLPNGALVKIHVIVVGGIGGAKAKTGSEVFQVVPYKGGAINYWAGYDITGTTLKNTLQYGGLGIY